MSSIMDGRLTADVVKKRVAAAVRHLNKRGIDVRLAVILVGGDAASQVYVNSKKKACEALGILSVTYELAEDYGQENLLALINQLNTDPGVNGILCQLPLPAGYDEREIINAINPVKDVDAFHPINVGKIMLGEPEFLPCTPAGIMEMLDYYGIEVEGKECVVVGRSNIVGKPMSMLLLHKNGTVTVAHSRTKALKDLCRRADILVAAVGKPNFITADMVKEGAVVIDVGINRVDGKLCGDVDYKEVARKASWITPVPGGVGPMTIAMLMQNTVTAARNQNLC